MGLRRVLAAMVLLVPAAAGQPPPQPAHTFDVDAPAGLLAPGTETQSSGLRLAVSCSQDELEAGPSGQLAANLTVGAHPGESAITLSPTSATWSALSPEKCLDAAPRHFLNGTALVVVTRKVPAFAKASVPLSATVAFRKVTGEAVTWGPFLANITFTPGYHGLLEVRPASYVLKTEGPDASVTFPVQVTSLSNGPSVLRLTAAAHGGRPELAYVLPPEVELPAGVPAPAEQQVDVVVKVPGAVFKAGELFPFDVTFTLASTDPRGGVPQVQVLTLQVQTPDARRTPTGADVALLAPALALAWTARRRLERDP